MKTGKSSEELLAETSTELHEFVASLTDVEQLPEPLRSVFHLYMDEAAGNHRFRCKNECCAIQCSAW